MFLILFGCVFTFLASVFVINRYFSFKLHKNSFQLTLCVLTLNMILLLATDFLLPLDIFHTSIWPVDSSPDGQNNSTAMFSRDDQLTTLTEIKRNHYFKFIWLSIYWLQFVICWFIIPVLISYVSLKYAVARTQIKERFIKAMYQNLKFYSLCLAGLIVGLIYLITSTGHSLYDFKPLLISMSHLYSLSYTLVLLSSGLIILPRDLLKFARNPSIESSNSLFVELSKANEDLNDSQLSIIDKAGLILNTRETTNGDVIFNEMLTDAKLEIESKLASSKINSESIFSHANNNNRGTSTINTLDKLNNTFNKFTTNYFNFIYYQTKSNSIIHTLALTNNSTITTAKRLTSIIFGIITVVLSTLVIVLEIVPIKRLHNWIFFGKHWYNFTLVFVILCYNTLSSLYAMSKFKFNNFHLIATGNSNPSNMLYYSLYSSRLLFPLCFNLMALIPDIQSTENDSVFGQTLYHDLKVIPLVNFLNSYLPLFFLIVIPISYKYDIKQKILLKVLGEEYYYQFFGMMIYEPDNETTVPNDTNILNTLNTEEDDQRYRLNEDYEYSLQDGRYLFERASTIFYENSSTNEPISLSDNVSNLNTTNYNSSSHI